MKRLLTLVLGAGILLGACRPAPAAVPPAGDETAASPTIPAQMPPELYVAIVWHQHQPFYAVDPATGLVQAPWVRLHAAKDYVDMAAMLEQYPNVHVTFNLTPSLIRQLDALAAGQRDLAWQTSLVPADALTADQQDYLRQRFFDVNPKIMARFPRYGELAALRDSPAAWSAQDYRDLQALFNLAWTDPDWLSRPPLDALVAKGRGYSDEDIRTILAEHERLIADVIPLHARLQQAGQIEITTTPYAHPILPLLIDSNLARIASPDLTLPDRFAFGRDAVEQLARGVQLYQEHFGQTPHGMWPAEGAVAQEMVGAVYRAGLQWMLTDEGILAKSLGLDFARNDSGVPANATALYRPYAVAEQSGQPVVIFFRDTTLSNRVSFDYSNMPAEQAVDDFLGRLRAIRDSLRGQPGGPFLVTVILDGENAWEYYDNDGKEFLHGLYAGLSADPTIRAVTPTEFLTLAQPAPQTIPALWAGSWDSATFETWIGEPEENKAWTYLGRVRADLAAAQKQIPEAQYTLALQSMLAAEGSDWFWWYGGDKDSGNDTAFDAQFRETLGQVYDALGRTRPDFLRVPIIYPPAVEPDFPLRGLTVPRVDGTDSVGEWASGGHFNLFGSQPSLLHFGFSRDQVGFKLTDPPAGDFSIYLRVASIAGGSPLAVEEAQVLEMDATHRIAVNADGTARLEKWENNAWTPVLEANVEVARGEVLELALPHAALWPALDAGDALLMRLVTADGSLFPAAGPGRLLVPDLGRVSWLVEFEDPTGDDHGPGTYTYPTDSVFAAGVFDLAQFEAGVDESNVVFRIQMRGPVENPWGSPNGLALQTVEIYLDTDRSPQTGARLLREARNAALTADYGWDLCITLAGWAYGAYRSDSPEKADPAAPVSIVTDPARHIILARIPRSALPGDPREWNYAVVVLSNDGYGVNNVREVLPVAERWRVGGAAADSNHTRILDYLWPAGLTPTQEEMLGTYPSSQATVRELTADDFAQLRMLSGEAK